MIGYLNGTLLFRHDPYLTIDVHGVGYKVFASSEVLSLFHIGQEISVYVHTHVREDALELYGFLDEGTLELFELLISVSGIGPKTAIGIFGQGKKEEILQAIRKADVDFFTGVPRLGRKNAQKLIIELKGKLGSVEEVDLGEGDSEVMQVLIGFGFSMEEARRSLREIGDKGTTTAEKVKLALRHLGK